MSGKRLGVQGETPVRSLGTVLSTEVEASLLSACLTLADTLNCILETHSIWALSSCSLPSLKTHQISINPTITGLKASLTDARLNHNATVMELALLTPSSCAQICNMIHNSVSMLPGHVSVAPRDFDHALLACPGHATGYESFRRKSLVDDGSLPRRREEAVATATVFPQPHSVVGYRLSSFTNHGNQLRIIHFRFGVAVDKPSTWVVAEQPHVDR